MTFQCIHVYNCLFLFVINLTWIDMDARIKCIDICWLVLSCLCPGEDMRPVSSTNQHYQWLPVSGAHPLSVAADWYLQRDRGWALSWGPKWRSWRNGGILGVLCTTSLRCNPLSWNLEIFVGILFLLFCSKVFKCFLKMFSIVLNIFKCILALTLKWQDYDGLILFMNRNHCRYEFPIFVL